MTRSPRPNLPIALTPRPAKVRSAAHDLLEVKLDDAQKAAVNLPSHRSLLVLGEAGHGKTTVALFRLAKVMADAPRSFRAVVIVPTEGLRRLLEPLTVKLGIDVPVMLYEKWAQRQARSVFTDIPKKESRTATAGVVRAKRDPALMIAIEEIAERPPGLIDDDADAPKKRTRAHARHGDLQHLFGDRVLMETVLRAAQTSPYADSVLGEILEHTHVQFERTTEEANSDVDRARLRSVDRLAIDEGTPNEDARSIDAEDYAVLFEIDRLRAKYTGIEASTPKPFDLIVLDEAQELAPLELALIGRSIRAGGALVVAGDADQQVDPAVTFTSWTDTMHALRCDDHDEVVLDIGYRCPPTVTTLAKHVIDPRVACPQDVSVITFDSGEAVAKEIARALLDLDDRDPGAAVAVICRTHTAARAFAAVLKKELPCRLVLDGRFLPGAGRSICAVTDVKGLEFDHVIVPDASIGSYPDTPASRRALYVAVTRARHQVLLAAGGPPTPIV